MEVAGVKEYWQLQQENARLKKLLAKREPEIDVMKEVIAKKWCRLPPAEKRWSLLKRITSPSGAVADLFH